MGNPINWSVADYRSWLARGGDPDTLAEFDALPEVKKQDFVDTMCDPAKMSQLIEDSFATKS